jgi:hypothetical protein
MATISDTDWTQIKLASSLPDNARKELNTKRKEFIEDLDQDFEVGQDRVKEAINKALKFEHKLSGILSRLEADNNYRSYNTAGVPLGDTELDQAWSGLVRLRERLTDDKKRFSRRNMRERNQIRLNRYVRWLLEFQKQWLRTRLPVQARETATSVRFRAYVEMCCRGCSGDIDRALETVTREFARQRKTMRGSVTDR